ncbi:MAG: hypothetical protein QOE65_1837 [Solirubrobacteraceae bacterium]|nr:hypothetical protein [Solirubrobacteraceae bacterium]
MSTARPRPRPHAQPHPRRRLPAAERREVIERAALDVFTERGYHGASMDEIARRSGVTVPVVYDHFASKVELHKRLLERTRDELVAMWAAAFAGDAPLRERFPPAIEAWAVYVESHPYAPRMFFHETTGVPEVQVLHRAVQEGARQVFAVMVGHEAGPEYSHDDLVMAAEVMRSGLTGLAVWWQDHPDVPRERVVAAALNVVWAGLERLSAG